MTKRYGIDSVHRIGDIPLFLPPEAYSLDFIEEKRFIRVHNGTKLSASINPDSIPATNSMDMVCDFKWPKQIQHFSERLCCLHKDHTTRWMILSCFVTIYINEIFTASYRSFS